MSPFSVLCPLPVPLLLSVISVASGGAAPATGFVGVTQDDAGTWWLQRKPAAPATATTPLMPNVTEALHVPTLVPNMLDEPLFLTIGTSHVGNAQPRDVSQTFDRHLNFSA